MLVSSARALLAPSLAAALAVASCHSGYRPLQVADACRCSPSQYCHVRAGSPAECLPLPPACGASPGCACVGRRIDACREELGALTVIEPRTVARCDECSADEYCWHAGDAQPLCRVMPARCEDAPSCDCLLTASRGGVACEQRQGRLEAGPGLALTTTSGARTP
jgi:hypothetical protein